MFVGKIRFINQAQSVGKNIIQLLAW